MGDVPATAAHDPLVLAGPITSETAACIRQRLVQHLEISGSCLIEAAAVTELDSVGAELLGAFVQAITRRDGAVRWVSVSPSLLVSARALGMESWLGLASH
jgi:ABC-type transporter Mla MlaB component